ncbi:chloride channel protein [Culicoidibacter larvae]|uniref:Chloride channel protein n=1 Tax=Culicoidibacter larvae TaxID=2579976 RepID=A0A5R8QBF0_9FIRM|nr:chloride channel protein [Culicoidibacter larvae]TLG72955.1 hypothetical protein FEZ08_07865 [Culicoidibacter larvae]
MIKVGKRLATTLIATGITALILSAFLSLLTIAENIFFTYPLLLLGLPLAGVALLALYNQFGRNAGLGNLLLLSSYRAHDQVPMRMSVLAPLATIVSHFFGASVGREGIGLQVGGSLFSGIAGKLGLDEESRRILLLSGVSAGFSIIFGTPLTGIVFGFEFIGWREYKWQSAVYSVIAAFLGVWVTQLLGITHAHFQPLIADDFSLATIFKIMLIGVAVGVGARLFILLVRACKRGYKQLFQNPYIRIAVAGSVVALVALLLQTVRYQGLGLDLISDAFIGQTSLFDGIAKIVTTGLSIGGGFYGGEVTPLFAMGASLGSAIAVFFGLSPLLGASIGYVGLFSGAARAPLTGIVLGFELFGWQGLLFYAIVCGLAVLITGKRHIYTDLSI